MIDCVYALVLVPSAQQGDTKMGEMIEFSLLLYSAVTELCRNRISTNYMVHSTLQETIILRAQGRTADSSSPNIR